jgi:selenocysteine-specific elongation factor
VIVGTAGHIDHGKTSLVKALTGIDADRLKEEKERGITVDLGFAFKSMGDGSVLGFVDVPGHEKLVHNMLAGATGIDHVLMVVAADDGPMPQTREHLAILDMLGLTRGVVALTKADLVTPERLAQAMTEVRAMLAPTGLADAEVIALSSVTGQGLDALGTHLAGAMAEHATGTAAHSGGHFRLAIDRSFSLAGIGTVVTGTVVSGQVAVGDNLLLSPRGQAVRVRGLQVHSRKAEHGQAGQRLAVNLAGVEKNDVQRGDWLLSAPAHAPTQRIDARLRLLANEARPLEHWTPVHLHLGAEDVGARVALLEGQSIQPGATALVQLELDRPIGGLHGDRFIVRDQSAQRTLGGGAVLDIFAPPNSRSGRRKAQRLTWLAALEQPAAEAALASALALEQPNGVDLAQFVTLWNLLPDAQAALTAAVPHRLVVHDKARLLFTPGQVDQFQARVVDLLRAHHQRNADSPGLTLEQLQRAFGAKANAKPNGTVFSLLLRELAQTGVVQRAGPHLHLPGHSAELQGSEKQLWERFKPWLDEGGIAPPKLSDMLLRDRTLRKDQVMRMFQRAERMGKVFAVGAEYFVQREHILQLAVAAQKLADADPNKRVNVKDLREATGMNRHLSIPLMEFFDAIGFTQRDALGRHIRRDAHKMFGGS